MTPELLSRIAGRHRTSQPVRVSACQALPNPRMACHNRDMSDLDRRSPNRQAVLTLRMSIEERDILNRAAQDAGLSTSDYLRKLALGPGPRGPRAPRSKKRRTSSISKRVTRAAT